MVPLQGSIPMSLYNAPFPLIDTRFADLSSSDFDRFPDTLKTNNLKLYQKVELILKRFNPQMKYNP